MISGTGLPSAGLTSLTNLLTGNTVRGLFGLPARSDAPDSNNTGEKSDTIQLTEAGRSALQAIEEGLTDRQRQEAEFSIAHLNELEERIKVTRSLLGNAGPEQVGLIYNQLDEIAGSLGTIGNQIGFILSEGPQPSAYAEEGERVDLQSLIDQFRDTVRQLASLLGVSQSHFEQRPIIPQPLLDAIRQLFDGQGEEPKKPLLVNEEA